MKELKSKEVIIGLIIIIILGIIAIFLLIRREKREIAVKENTATESTREEDWAGEEKESTDEGENDQSDEQMSSSQQNENKNILKVETTQESVLPKEEAKLYTILGQENYQSYTLVERKTDDGQLKELFEYWDAYKMEAVNDLLRLERIKKISAELNGTNKFYYYGALDSLGRPHGRGLAVYGNNTYYCGDWKEGLRSGQGMWLQVAIYDEENEELNLGVLEHMYNGRWNKDLPNGQGQEHFSYDYTILDVEDKIIANVIGNFKDGYYNGEMYIMSTDSQGNKKDWDGVCKKGVWDILLEGNTTKGVWRSTEMNQEDYEYYFMFPQDNVNQGIYGLKK